MAKLRKTLLIGLGGTGFQALLNAKKMFYENYGEVPPMIGFLGIDTDAPNMQQASKTAKDGTVIRLNSSELLSITVDEPRQIYELHRGDKLFSWLPEANVHGLDMLSKGAGQMRSNGRFAITVNENNVSQILRRKLDEVNNANIIDNTRYDLLGADTEVHIVFSLGGGTGSGTFLNLAYLVQRLMPKAKVSGYAVLADVFRSMVSGAQSARVRSNAKGAIMDLDYLAHMDANSVPLELHWFQLTQKVSQRPFSALYLIDNKNENNDTFSHVDPISQMVSLAIVTSVGELGVAMDSVSDNVNKLIGDGAMDVRNKKAWVAGFGCVEILFDGDRLSRIYCAKSAIQIINIMLNGGCDDPAIIANAWFDNNKIRENLGKDDVTDYFMSPTPQYIFQDIDNPDNPEPDALAYIANRGMESATKLNTLLEQLQSRIDESLTKLMNEQANRECGVFLCNQILHNILTQLELSDGEMKNEMEEREADLPRFESALKAACSELKDCMGTLLKIGRKDKTEEVINRTMALTTLKREIERRRMARLFYNWLRVRISQSLDRVDVIMRNLEAVRVSCNDKVQRLQREGAGASFFQFDLAADYAERVSCPLTDVAFNDFASLIRPEGGVPAIAGMTTQQTEDIIMGYARTMPKAKAYREMSVDDHLDALSDDEVKSLLRRAIDKSKPLLPYSYRGWDADLREYPVESFYIGIANKATSRLVKNDLFRSLVANAKDVQFSEIGLGNRVIIYRQLGVVPPFTLRALDNYNSEYDKWEADKPHGSHWDEQLCQRMEKERFRLDPANISPNIFETWMQCIIYGLITYNADSKQYQIRCRDKALGGKALRGWLVDMGGTRSQAFSFFEDNFDVIEPDVKRVLQEMDVPGPDNPLRAMADAARQAAQANTYLQTISKCPISMDDIAHYPAEEELIEKEMEYVLTEM